MNTQRVSSTVQDRIAVAEAADWEMQGAEHRFYQCTGRLEQLDKELFHELDAAWVDCIEAIRRVAWLDGWQCGRNPDLLVTFVGTVER